MKRHCTCDRALRGRPYSEDQCYLCWLFWNDPVYRALWSGAPASATAQSISAASGAAAAPAMRWGLGRKLLGVSRAAFKFAASGFAVLPDAQVQARLAICGACPHWKGKCKICGCASVKQHLPGEQCPDNPPRWYALPTTKPEVRSWALGITTYNGRETLEQTCRSLESGGWTDAVLFEDLAQPTESERAACLEWWAGELAKGTVSGDPSEINFRQHAKLAWRNWFGALEELVRTSDADAIMLCQDDVIVARNIRTFLEYDLWPENVGAVSLYCSARYTTRRPGRRDRATGEIQTWWEPLETGLRQLHPDRELWGAHALIFPRASAMRLLEDPAVHKLPGNRIDQRVRQFCTRHKLGLYIYRPSLAQHIGTTAFGSGSTIGHATSGADMLASDFVGEDTDVTATLLRG